MDKIALFDPSASLAGGQGRALRCGLPPRR